MTMSLAKAIVRLEDEPRVIKKIVVMTILSILSAIISMVPAIMAHGGIKAALETQDPTYDFIGSLLVLPITIYLTGFVFQSMHKTFNSDRFQMIELNEKNLLVDGAKYFLGLLGYSVLYMLVAAVGIILLMIVMSIIRFLIGLIAPPSVMVIILGVVLVCSASIVFMLFFQQLYNVALTAYIKTLDYGSLFALDKHFGIIKNNQHASWTLIGKMILYFLLLILVIVVLSATVIGILLVPFVVVAAQFVYFNLLDQYAKQIEIEKYL